MNHSNIFFFAGAEATSPGLLNHQDADRMRRICLRLQAAGGCVRGCIATNACRGHSTGELDSFSVNLRRISQELNVIERQKESFDIFCFFGSQCMPQLVTARLLLWMSCASRRSMRRALR